MVRSGWLAAGIALMALVQAGGAQAQSVHKCIINGAPVYQAAACPASNDGKSLVIPPPPTQQELLDATANGRLQSYQPGSGLPSPNSSTAQRRYDRSRGLPQLTPSQQLPQEQPRSACDQLNATYHEAQYRRAELSAPGTNGAHSDALDRVNDELRRTADQANQTHCQLRQ